MAGGLIFFLIYLFFFFVYLIPASQPPEIYAKKPGSYDICWEQGLHKHGNEADELQ